MTSPPAQQIRAAVRAALDEDLSAGDITTACLFPDPILGRGSIVAHSPMVVAGVAVARLVFTEVDESLQILPALQDGQSADTNQVVLSVEGDARSILMGERVALNFLQHLSGIATLTHQFRERLISHSIQVFDTRKTTPGLRALEKWAVRLGGGLNHRHSLGDGVLIKDNHLHLLRSQGFGVVHACRWAKDRTPPGTTIIVEVQSLDEVQEALDGKADVIMLDNLSPESVKLAVNMIGDQARIEASGGVTLSTVESLTGTGVHSVSIGALTHSAPAANLSLDVVPLEVPNSTSSN